MKLMNRLMTTLLALAIFTGITPAYGQSFTGMTRPGAFLPENNYLIAPKSVRTNQMTEQVFNQILDQVYAAYAPIFKSKGLTFQIQRNWTDGTVNAYADRQGSTALIAMFGGLARHPAVTVDGFFLVACHEIGHHLGGVPLVSSWASNEGQADYFGTLKCLRRVFSRSNNFGFVNSLFQSRSMLLDNYALNLCKQAHTNPADQAICVRASAAGLSLALVFQDLSKLPQVPRYETPDKTVVAHTNNEHPAPQCRLDTYFQGALCPVNYVEDTSATDPTVGTCTLAKKFPIGTRPLCWYSPADAGETLARRR